MKSFMDEDFLLKNDAAVRLYHEYAEEMPVFDYHCHLNPREIADNIRQPGITAAWLGGDHYKWRLMRANGMDERAGSDHERFLNWADTVAHSVGNPMYHWTHLELKRYFGITETFSPETAEGIYEKANDMLAHDDSLTVYGIFKKFRVYAVGTTDDPADTLESHRRITAEGLCPAKVVPSFRPDRALNAEKPDFNAYLELLGEASGMEIRSREDVLSALSRRLDYFAEQGCLSSDHSVSVPPFLPAGERELDAVFEKARAGKEISPEEAEKYRTWLLTELAKLYCKKGMVMQLHLQASRNNNSRIFNAFGADMGCDAISDYPLADRLSGFLNALEKEDLLPKMILYSLNPKDYYVLGSLAGCFQKEIPGKLQLGAAWWFNDHIDGMTEQLRTLGNLGLLSRFTGMLTDSRSFLSYPRHEYFRRILCNLLGTLMEDGEAPYDFGFMGGMVRDISFRNAEVYFGKQK